jgi:hypothetical protein
MEKVFILDKWDKIKPGDFCYTFNDTKTKTIKCEVTLFNIKDLNRYKRNIVRFFRPIVDKIITEEDLNQHHEYQGNG